MRFGLYKSFIILFGLLKILATFQYYINNVLYNILNDYAIAYINNILIFLGNQAKYDQHIGKVLKK